MPEEPDQEPTPRRHRPRLSDLAGETLEDDLWNLDDDGAAPQSEIEVQPRKGIGGFPQKSPKTAEPEPEKEPQPAAEAEPAVSLPEDDEESPPPQAAQPAAEKRQRRDFPLRPAEDDLALDDEDEDAGKTAEPAGAESREAVVPDKPQEELPKPEKPAPAAKAEPKSDGPPTPSPKLEKIGLISTAVVLVAIALWWIIGSFANVSTTELGADFPDLPAKGEYARIDEVDTYWRKPVREGDQVDAATAEAAYIPVVLVTLHEQGSGTLRVLFRDSDGDFVGDAISRSFRDGVFEKTGSATAEFAATDGFHEVADFNGYRVGEDRWQAEIFEGPSENASGKSFKSLLVTPLFPKHD
ncbi:hypothetical protein [Haloferula sargassicola]|uniref:Uncharacterized protein n=1 Tax=Haloferula sargassicola TaxID=490096 RepID=A0ABP9UN27_9BACT